jgi:Asp-tRNA(Asn)/Glu-tRNA(Gln) amidotransferase A subunit family amidase
MSSDDLCRLGIEEALTLFRTRRLSPVELLQALLERAAETEPLVNALAEQFNEKSLAAARLAEGRYMQRNSEPRPLEGIPFSVKVSMAVQGRRMTSGSLVYKDRVSDVTEPTVQRLLDAGGVFHAQTASPEFSWAWVCYSRLYGVTRNPWNTEITAGGSCGGSAAAVAVGSTMFSIGADSAGSIRMPSAMCGVVGFKPPSGRNPEGVTYCDDLYNDYGPITRSVGDCVTVQNVISGPHPLDNNSLKPKLELSWPPESISGLHLAYSMDLGFMQITDDVRRNTLSALDKLRDAGASVEEVSMDWAQEACDAADWYGDFMAGDLFADMLKNHKDELTDYTPYFAEICLQATREQFIESFLATNRAWCKFSEILEHHDAFLCPTVATTQVPAEMKPWEDMIISDQVVDRWVLTLLFSMFRTCPVMTVPSGLADNGVPTGLQVVGRTFDDATVMGVAAAVEAGIGNLRIKY